MRLSPRKIPDTFARAIPRGFRLVKRQGHDFLLVESVFCPKGHNLIQMANSLNAPVDVMNAAAELNPEFMLTRNPDSADGVPAQMYDKGSARLHLRCANDIVEWAKMLI